MQGFLGIDIGTTNSKALLLSEAGTVIHIWNAKTPHVRISGLEFFDLNKIEKVIESFILAAKEKCQLTSVSVSSVGESVVPVKNGKAIGLPLLWYEDNFKLDEETLAFIEQRTGFANTGVGRSKTYSVYKIIWMQKHLLKELPEFWLPISSYLIYRKTGRAIWDTSQAGRSYAYHIHHREWIEDIVDQLSPASLGEIGKIGAYCGHCDGIAYGLSGHDHYVGLYGIYELYQGAEFFYDSMGSSSVLAMVKDNFDNKLGGRNTYNPKGGCLVTGFEEGEYIVNRSIDYYGRIIACLMNIRGECGDHAYFAHLNAKIMNHIQTMRPCLIGCENGQINFLALEEKTSFEEMVLGGYYYLALGTLYMFNDLIELCHGEEGVMPYFVGGQTTNNGLMMKLKATVLGRELITLKTTEISALGAAISALKAVGREDVLPYAKDRLLYAKTICPDTQYEPFVKEMKAQYEERNQS